MATCYDWPTMTAKIARGAWCVIHGNYRSYIYSMANVMQHEREAFNVGALTNAAAGERVVIFVNGNF